MHTPEYSGLKGAQLRLAPDTSCPGPLLAEALPHVAGCRTHLENRASLRLQRLFQLKDVLMQIEIYALAHERHAFHP